MRALAGGPAVVVGTPGRLLDHLKRGGIDTGQVAAITLDEADRMLDLGFREDLEAILALAPQEHRTHLVSATFPRDVRTLADRVQKSPAHVQGTRLGEANADIDHVVHLVDPHEKVAAIVNLLLASPDTRTLVFARTRADVAHLAKELHAAGFAVSSLSGEMEQIARNRALAAFKNGDLDVLVATDVAARGIDVQDILRVIHVDPPNDADTYTHRSGRTGRAGKKGTSSMLVSPAALVPATRLLKRAGVPHRFEAVPSPEQIRAATDERLVGELTAPHEEGFAGYDDRTWGLAKRLVAAADPTRTIARLLVRTRYAGKAEPREVHPVLPPGPRTHGPRPPGLGPRTTPGGGWIPFHVSWGANAGADTRRLLAMVCRRGQIRGSDVGAIRVERNFAIVDVAAPVAEAFERAASEPDPRDPRTVIQRDAHPKREGNRSSRDGAPRKPRPHGARKHAPREHGPRESAPREDGPPKLRWGTKPGGPRTASAPHAGNAKLKKRHS
jgi:ATP-dependent RNA helicase DeaD